MVNDSRRGVVTGLGVLSSIGSDLDTFWQGLLAGKSGIKRIGLFDPSELPCQIAGEMTDFDAKNFLEKKDRPGPSSLLWPVPNQQLPTVKLINRPLISLDLG